MVDVRVQGVLEDPERDVKPLPSLDLVLKASDHLSHEDFHTFLPNMMALDFFGDLLDRIMDFSHHLRVWLVLNPGMLALERLLRRSVL